MVAFKKNRRLGEVAKVISGYAFKSSEFLETGIPVIKIKNIKLGEVDMSGTQFVSKEYLKIDDKFHVKKGDILISLTGSHINQPNSVVGRVALFPKIVGNILLNQRAGKIMPINDECDMRFLYYQLYEKEMRKDIASFAHGAANQANVSPSQVESLTIRTPPLNTQRKIAFVLAAYDDLIENNLRRIKILEEIAQNLYREWFVNFRFPGHEQTHFVDSPLGQIPEGWEVKYLGEVCEQMQSGGTPSRSKPEYWDGGEIYWYKTMELWDNFLFDSKEKITNKGLANSSAKILPVGSILMAIYGSPTVGRLGILTCQASCNQAALGMRAKTSLISQPYLFYLLYYLRDHFNNIAQGAAQQNISKDKVAKTQCVIPSNYLMTQFTDIITTKWRLLVKIQKKNNTLRQTRDLLLPKLISGEVDVSEIDIKVPEEVAI